MGDATRPVDRAAHLDSAVGWVTVAVAFVATGTVFGVAYGFGAFFAPMAEEFGSGSGPTSAVFSLTAFCFFTLGSVSGRAADRFGPRPVLLVGAAALVVGLVITSRVQQLWLGYLSYGLGVGVAVACGYVPMVAVVGAWFDRQRGLALAVAVAGIGVGTLVGAPVAAALIGEYGWRTTFVLLGVGGAVLLLGCAAAVRRPPQVPGAAPLPVRQLARTRAFGSLYVSTTLAALALFVPLVFLPSFAATLGAGPVAAATLVGIVGVASVLGRLAIGGLADRLGRVRTYQASFAILAASFPIWGLARSYPVLVVFAVVLGVGYGGWIALQPAVIADIFGVGGLGGVVGLVYTAAGVGALVGPPLAGLIIDSSDGYGGAVLLAGLAGLGSFVALLPLGRVPRPADRTRGERPEG